MCESCKYHNGVVYMIKHRTNNYLNDNQFYYIGVSLDLQTDILKHRSNAYHFERVVSWDCAYRLYYLINLREESVCSYFDTFNNPDRTNEWNWKILGEASSKIDLDVMENYFVDLYKPKLNGKLNNGLWNKYYCCNNDLDILIDKC